MMKKLTKVIVATILAASSLAAESTYDSIYGSDTNSLIGFEAGYSAFDYERTTSGVTDQKKTVNFNHGGVKIGAETNDYRLFLSARAFDGGDFDYARAYGVELQYLLNISKMANVFFGVNAGKVDMKLADKTNSKTVKINEGYVGGDVGVNIHLGKRADFEVGARFMSLNSSATDGLVKYDFDNIVTGYASIIFKYQMD
ncbi:hypothetical protein [Sulfurimonas sp.]|uniref:hypothetical protein n=1 Tax=Sulfurimonas sp. TaxID=2022749 RepID=UPI0035693725